MNYGYRYALCITAATGILAASYYFYTIDNKSKAKPYLSLKGEKSMNNGQAEDQSVESEDFHEEETEGGQSNGNNAMSAEAKLNKEHGLKFNVL
ncbi:hypothetical protein EB796_014264 [Bugula neritina]|uniref:Uncharacterized protein n=1 Tax=Bugula neritina TaxID=10212 RepID=A0A7J7JMW0_BUGNE|nr:hypothetical protein EB796_014264 [Bugula neritina]